MKRAENARGFTIGKVDDALEIALMTGNESETYALGYVEHQLMESYHIDDILFALEENQSRIFNFVN